MNELDQEDVVGKRMKILFWIFGAFAFFLVYYLAFLMGVIDTSARIAYSI